jgi:WhiB family redox-sensing transcriptional regulator
MGGNNGGHNPANPALTNAQVGEAIHQYRNGAAAADIANQLNVTEAAIHYHLRKRGIAPRTVRTPTPPRQPSAAKIMARTRGLAELPDALTAALAGDPTDTAWQRDALCAQTDPEEFYPDKGGSTAAAKAVCRRCPVAAECLDYALANNEGFGVWGGLSERERRKLRPPLPPGPAPIRHGTPAGAKAHYRAGEKPCPLCSEANAAYARRRKAS